MWLTCALVSYAILAVVFILDKLIVSNSEVKPAVYTFYSTIIMFGAILAWPFVGAGLLSGIDWCFALFSGICFGFGLWTFYLAVKKGETTHISPFNGAMVTIFIYFFASSFLGEKLNFFQQIGVVVLVLASLFLSFEKSRQHNGFHSGFIWAIISGVFFAASHVSAKYLYNSYSFWTALIWSKSTVGFVGIFTLFFSSVRNSLKFKNSKKISQKQHVKYIIFGNKILSVLSAIILQYSFSIGSPTLVGALSGLQFVLMFIMVYLLTKLVPKIFKEYFTKREIVVQIIALILVLLGSALFVL